MAKQGLLNSHPDLMLTGGIEYQYSPGKAGPETILSDREGDRQYAAWSVNRWRTHPGVEGRISNNLTANAKVKNSAGGKVKTDYSGMFGDSYRF